MDVMFKKLLIREEPKAVLIFSYITMSNCIAPSRKKNSNSLNTLVLRVFGQ